MAQSTAPGRRGPGREELLRYVGGTVPPVAAPSLRVLFCGINPGLWTAWTGFHFARPGNRFWPALHRSGFTPRQLAPAEQHELLGLGLGITNVVERATATAAELTKQEIRAGGERLVADVQRWAPRFVAVLGVTTYRTAFDDRTASVGPQERRLAGARVWLLPNPSGLNAHYSLDALSDRLAELRRAVEG